MYKLIRDKGEMMVKADDGRTYLLTRADEMRGLKTYDICVIFKMEEMDGDLFPASVVDFFWGADGAYTDDELLNMVSVIIDVKEGRK